LQGPHFLSGSIVNWILSDYLLEKVLLTHRLNQALTRLPEYTIERIVIEARISTLAYHVAGDMERVARVDEELEEPRPA